MDKEPLKYRWIRNVNMDPNLSYKEKCVAWVIHDHAWGDKQSSFPSFAKIEASLGGRNGGKNIGRSINKLVAAGYLEITKKASRSGNYNEYRMVIPTPPQHEKEFPHAESATPHSEVNHPRNEGGNIERNTKENIEMKYQEQVQEEEFLSDFSWFTTTNACYASELGKSSLDEKFPDYQFRSCNEQIPNNQEMEKGLLHG